MADDHVHHCSSSINHSAYYHWSWWSASQPAGQARLGKGREGEGEGKGRGREARGQTYAKGGKRCDVRCDAGPRGYSTGYSTGNRGCPKCTQMMRNGKVPYLWNALRTVRLSQTKFLFFFGAAQRKCVTHASKFSLSGAYFVLTYYSRRTTNH